MYSFRENGEYRGNGRAAQRNSTNHFPNLLQAIKSLQEEVFRCIRTIAIILAFGKLCISKNFIPTTCRKYKS